MKNNLLLAYPLIDLEILKKNRNLIVYINENESEFLFLIMNFYTTWFLLISATIFLPLINFKKSFI